jgi:hypothetical protein
MRMPFGRFKGAGLASLPEGYIHWLASLNDLRGPLRTAVEDEIECRAYDTRPSPAHDACPGSQRRGGSSFGRRPRGSKTAPS